jgi:hypothetical protein
MMTTQELEEQTIIEEVVEIRYEANPRVLDYRGTWAHTLINELGLKHWRISENRVDLYDTPKPSDATVSAFVSHRNAGTVVRSAEEGKSAADVATRIIRLLYSDKLFGAPVAVQRIGVRSRLAIPFMGSFSELLDRYRTRVVNVSQAADISFSQRKMKIVDVGGPINFEAPNGKIHSTTGPMAQEQLADFFSFRPKDELPLVALYLDFDYWDKPSKTLSVGPVLQRVREYSDFLAELQSDITALVLD